jgi:uroporphyrinogen III methyltransferase/synthase
MGLVNFGEIAAEMIAKGRSADTPAMAVRWATRPDQQTLVGTLGTLPTILSQAGLKPPATIVVGEVVSLRERFNWFERLPLFGQRVVVTRDRRQAAEFADPLEELGAEVLTCPVIQIQPPSDSTPLDRALLELHGYDWLIFTSANGVKYFAERLDASPTDLRSLRAKICAIGPGTKATVEALHLKVDRLPKEFVAESMLEALQDDDMEGKRVLIPRAAVARDIVPVELRKRGAAVDLVEAYRTVEPENLAELVERTLARKPHWVTFTSSSTAANFLSATTPHAMRDVKIASIGPITSATARKLGYTVAAEADPHTIPGLLNAIAGESRRAAR